MTDMKNQSDEILDDLQKSWKVRLAHIAEVEPESTTQSTPNGPVTKLTHLNMGGERLAVTQRFMQSFCTRFGQSPSVFNLVPPDYLFKRIAEKHPRAEFVLTTIKGRALAMTSANTPRVSPDMLKRVLHSKAIGSVVGIERDRQVNPETIGARRPVRQINLNSEGVIQTTHLMPTGAIKLGTDDFTTQFLLETPLDGYGNPATYIGLLRLVCTNGMFGMRPSFRSYFKIAGSNNSEIVTSFERALSSYQNEEGFEAVSARMVAAQVTPPSLAEVAAFRALLVQEMSKAEDIERTLRVLQDKLGDYSEMYSIASPQEMDPKRQRLTPMRGTVADMINILTELTSHHRHSIRDANRLHAWVGDLINNSYDLEGLEGMDPTGEVEGRGLYLNTVLTQDLPLVDDLDSPGYRVISNDDTEEGEEEEYFDA